MIQVASASAPIGSQIFWRRYSATGLPDRVREHQTKHLGFGG